MYKPTRSSVCVAGGGSRLYAEGKEGGGYNTELHVEEIGVQVGFAEANREVIEVFYTSNSHKRSRVS